MSKKFTALTLGLKTIAAIENKSVKKWKTSKWDGIRGNMIESKQWERYTEKIKRRRAKGGVTVRFKTIKFELKQFTKQWHEKNNKTKQEREIRQFHENKRDCKREHLLITIHYRNRNTIPIIEFICLGAHMHPLQVLLHSNRSDSLLTAMLVLKTIETLR